MRVTRREAVVGTGAGVLALAAGCGRWGNGESQGALQASGPLDPDTVLLNRFGFGPNRADVARVKKIGADAWFEEQLQAPESDDGALAAKLWRLPMTHLSPWELRDWPEPDVLAQLQQAAILRAVESPWQLRERMVHFWTDHLNIYGKKGLAAYRKPTDEREVVRRHALGSFREMVHASSKSTAMLSYLDQQASSAAHPNENYARELLELHTLGVGGGYTQTDVMEAARCFTGWTEERGFLKHKGAFKFDPSLHDGDPKTVLGHRLTAGDVTDGEAVVDLAVKHPATSAHLARKLCAWFLGAAGEAVIPEASEAFRQTEGDVRSVLRVVYKAAKSVRGPQVVKRPFDFLVSGLRALGIETDGGKALQVTLADMGQPLYQWPMPDGYPIDAEAWTSSLLARWNTALALVEGRIHGTRLSPGLDSLAPHAVVVSVFGGALDAVDAKSLARQIAPLGTARAQIAACLCSPAFQWR